MSEENEVPSDEYPNDAETQEWMNASLGVPEKLGDRPIEEFIRNAGIAVERDGEVFIEIVLNTVYELERKFSALRASREKEKGELMSWRRVAERLEAEKKGLEAELERWKLEPSYMEGFKDCRINEVEPLKEANESLKARNAELETKYETLLCQDGFQALREAKNEIASLKAENAELRESLKVSEDLIGKGLNCERDLDIEIADLKERQKQVVEDNQRHDFLCKEQHKKISSLETEIDFLKDSRSKWAKQSSDNAGQIDTLTSRLSEALEALKLLRDFYEDYGDDVPVGGENDNCAVNRANTLKDVADEILTNSDNARLLERDKLRKAIFEKAVNDEPECPDEMPEEMYQAMQGDKDACSEIIRTAIRQTKKGILDRFREALEAHEKEGGV